MRKLLLGLSAILVSTSLAAQGIDLTEWEDDEPELLQGGNATSIKKGYGGRMPSSDPKLERQLQHYDKLFEQMDYERNRAKVEAQIEPLGYPSALDRALQQECQRSAEMAQLEAQRRQQQAEDQRRQQEFNAWLMQQQAQAQRMQRESERRQQAGVQAAEDWLNRGRRESERYVPKYDPWATQPTQPYVTQPVEPVEVPYTPTPWPQ